MNKSIKLAAELHDRVPPDWYFRSVKRNLIQKYVHGRRFEEVGKLVERVDGKVLDIGCADGVFTNVILKKSQASEIVGIDVLPKSVSWAKKHWRRNKKMKYQIGDAHKLSFPKQTFDAVVALEVLEHVFEPIKVLREIKRVLRKNGYAIFLVPAETLLFKIVWYLWKNYYVGRIWEDTHLHAYSNNYLVKLAKYVGFEIEQEKKIIFGCLHLIKVRKS